MVIESGVAKLDESFPSKIPSVLSGDERGALKPKSFLQRCCGHVTFFP